MLLKIIFSGFGGQGVLMMGYVLAVAGMKEDKHVTFLPAYGAEVRGGTANCTVVISDEEIASPIASSPEFVVAMNYPSMMKYQNMVKSGGVMFLNSDLISEDPARSDLKIVQVPANSLAHDMGNDRVLNMIMLGAVTTVTGIVSDKALAEAVETVLEGKKRALIDVNCKALTKGSRYISSKN
jgi:2-oxoglutarate ferredoxin oxidoreductase subunit gamma